jgi:hypothetical protein
MSPHTVTSSAGLLAMALLAAGCRGVLGIEPLPGIADAGADTREADAKVGADADAKEPMPDSSLDAGPPFCGTLPPPAHGQLICSDFDESETTFESGWDNDDQVPDPGDINGGLLTLDDALWFSAHRSLKVATPDNVSSTADVSAILVKTIGGVPPGSLIVDFEIYVSEEDVSSTGYILLADLDFGVGTASLYLDSMGLEFEISPQFMTVHPVLRPFPSGKWQSVQIIAENAPGDAGPDGWIHVSCSGNDATSALPSEFQSAGPLRVIIGSSAVGPVAAFAANYDNVVVYWGPP